jgi:hypothetical protein
MNSVSYPAVKLLLFLEDVLLVYYGQSIEVNVCCDVAHDLRKFVYDIMDSVRMKMNGLM